MRKLILFLATVMVLGFWNWSMTTGTWLNGPSSSDYQGGVIPTGTVVQNDIDEIVAAFNGGVGDTNCMEGMMLDLDKLEKGVMYHNEGYSSDKVMAYGDLNMHWACPAAAYNRTDTLLPDSAFTYLIDFCDSSDVGDPSFGSTPLVSLGPLSLAGSGISAPKTNTYAGIQAAVAGSLHYCLQWAAAGSCSVYVHYVGADTIFGGVQLHWEAKQK